jgi:hypothetical protein
MLVAMAITLIMMAAVVNLFATMGASVRNRRATIEMSGQLRMVRLRLHNDLVGATCPTLTWQRPGDDNGYLEIVEGQWSDKNPSGLLNDGDNDNEPDGLDVRTSLVPSSNVPNLPQDWVTDGRGLGDYDDILALTVRSEGEPFVGRLPVWNPSIKDGDGNNGWWQMTTIESSLAEVIWYAVENPADGSLGEPGMRTVYRRVLLIAPWIVTLPPYGTAKQDIADDNVYYRLCDVSFRREGDRRVPNTLGDLTKRENRYAHHINGMTTFPHAVQMQNIRIAPKTNASPFHPYGETYEVLQSMETGSSERQGEDVVLSDVLAFDVRVYDPGALLMQESATETILEPCDFGWNLTTGTLAGYGTYVDLGWYPGYSTGGLAAGAPKALYPCRRQVGWHPRNAGVLANYPAVYDTWSFHYENDGLDQDAGMDNGAGVDQGTNGLDDIVPYDLDNDPTTASEIPTDSNGNQIGINGVDDMGERETAPPYDVPLRGIQVKLRIYEPDTRNIRETTVTRNFVP